MSVPARRVEDEVIPELQRAIAAEVRCELHEATRGLRRQNMLLYVLMGAMLAAFVFAFENRTSTNRQATLRSCETLNAAIRESQSSSAGRPTQILIGGLLEVVRPQVRSAYRVAVRRRGGSSLPEIDCRRVASDEEYEPYGDTEKPGPKRRRPTRR